MGKQTLKTKKRPSTYLAPAKGEMDWILMDNFICLVLDYYEDEKQYL